MNNRHHLARATFILLALVGLQLAGRPGALLAHPGAASAPTFAGLAGQVHPAAGIEEADPAAVLMAALFGLTGLGVLVLSLLSTLRQRWPGRKTDTQTGAPAD